MSEQKICINDHEKWSIEVEEYAKHLCKLDNRDPSMYYVEYNRNTDEEVNIPNWRDYEHEAQIAVNYFLGFSQ